MKKLLLSFSAIAMLSLTTVAQSYYYIPDQGSNPGGLNTDPEFPEGGGQVAGWTRIVTGPAATPIWSAITAFPTDFSFFFNGSREQAFKVSSSGVLTFNTAAVTVPSYTATALPSSDVPSKSICIKGISSLASGDNVYTKMFGVAPKRQFWVHFSSYGYGSTASDGTNFTYWSIVLEEGTNNIYIVDQRTGGFANVKVVSAGIQLNDTVAFSVEGSPALQSKATTDASPADNHYYEFINGTQPTNDLKGISSPIQPDLALPQAPFTISANFRNVGTAAVTSAELKYQINNNTPVSTNLTGLNIAKYAYYTATSTTNWAPTTSGDYTIKIWMESPSGNADGNNLNDTIVKTVKVWDNFVVRKSLFEVFTSSTCPPCLPGNQVLEGVLDANPNKYTVIKYQYNFPGTGDPYFTTEAQARGTYYGGINSVPRLQIDGQWNDNPNSFNQNIFNQYQNKPSFVEINATQNIDVASKTITVNISVRPVVSLNKTYTLRTAIVERKTDNNVKNNGETEFHWVMKRILPSVGGEILTLNNTNINQTFTHEFTFPGNYRLPNSAQDPINLATEHSVEEFDDLVGVVFVQDDQTKEVLQSEWSSVAPISSVREQELKELGATIYPNPAKANFNVKLETSSTGVVTIFDLSGKAVMTTEISGIENNIDCSTLKNGLYMVEIVVDGQKAVKKLNIVQ